MKKTLISLVAGAALVMTSSAFALQSMDSDTMKDTTAQAGVSIAIDDVVVETWVGETLYTDTDTGASFVISAKHNLKTFHAFGIDASGAIHSIGIDMEGLANASLYDAATYGARATGLTIDIGTCVALTAGNQVLGNNDVVTGVVIGLPTLQICTSSDTYTVGIRDANGADGEFIQVTTGEKITRIIGGTLEIAPH